MKIMKKISNFVNKKRIEKEKLLLEEYEKGKLLQVNNNIDNKEFFRKK